MVKICKLYKAIASHTDALATCRKRGTGEWIEAHKEILDNLAQEHLPHGSGFDSGCQIDTGNSTGERIVIDSAFHLMNEGGYYDGWIHFTVVVTPSLISDFDLKIVGRFSKLKSQYYGHKDYFYDVFSEALGTECVQRIP